MIHPKQNISQSQYNNVRNIFMHSLLFLMVIVPIFSCDAKSTFATDESVSPLKRNMTGSPGGEVQKAFHEIYKLYRNRVVFITTEKKIRTHTWFEGLLPGMPGAEKKHGLGTGFILTEDGFVCTNHHVIAGSDKVIVRTGGKSYVARIIGSDPLTDLALLKIKGEKIFKPVFPGNSDNVRVGDWAIAIGNPFGLEGTFTVGVISANVRQGIDTVGNPHIQTDASINRGNSGGPLINLDGEVVGVNRMIYSKGGGSMGIGFAIPINVAMPILDELKKKGHITRGFIGVQTADMNRAIARSLRVRIYAGVLITGVLKSGPAALAGLKRGDIITAVSAKPIKKFRDLIRSIGRLKPGTRVSLRIHRRGRNFTVRLRVTERPSAR